MAGLVDFRFRQRPSKGVVILDLSLGPDALFRRFSQTKRNDIRRAIKCGVSVDLASGRDDVSAYYAVCLDWARRRFLRIADEEQFQRIFAVRTNRQLLLARYKGEVVAGLVLRYFPGGVVEHAANSSLQRALQVKPNDLLHWRAIEWACANGLTKYSLGGRSLFLRRFGGEIVPTTRHRMDLSLFRRHTIMDWMADKVEEIHPLVPPRILGLSRSLRTNINKLRSHNDGGSA